MKRNNPETKTSPQSSRRAHNVWILLRAALFTVTLITLFSTSAAFADPHRKPIEIVSPKKEIDYSMQQVEAKIRLEGEIPQKKLTIVLNGRDITKLFRDEDNQRRSGLLTKHLHESDGLRAGQNTLVVQGVDQTGLDFLVTRPFFITPPKGGGLGATAALPAAVTVNSSYIDVSNPDDLSSYSILLNGQLYNFAATCSANMTANYGMKVLVLDRQTLQVSGQKCFDTSTSPKDFQTYLAGLTSTQLVIASSFLQASNPQSGEPFDTTSIGGTVYNTCTSGVCNSPKIYSIIGVPGLQSGHAYETSQGPTVVQNVTDYPTLAGVLLQDQVYNYNFVPTNVGGLVRFKVFPGDSSGNPASVQIGDVSNPTVFNPPALPANWAGGYWLLLLHRYDLFYPISSTLYETYKSTSYQDSLAAALKGAPTDALVILTSLPSQTNNAPNVPTANLKAAIDSLGGAGYGLESGGKLGDAYTLVSTTDPQVPRSEAIVSSSKYSSQNQSGIVAGVMARDRSNLYKPMTYVQVASRADDDQSDGLQYDLYNILAQPSTPWPVPTTSGQTAAYVALSGQITNQFGCKNSPACSDYRSYYNDSNTTNNFCSTEPSSFSPPANPDGYTIEDYTTVQTQLQTEKIYVCNVNNLYDNISTLFSDSENNVALTLNAASTEVLKVKAPPVTGGVNVNTNRIVNLVLGLTRVIPVPGLQQGAGVAQALFQFSTSYEHSTTVSVVPTETLNLTVAQLDSGSVSQYIQLSSANDTVFEAIKQDWGKLSVIGSNIGNQAPGYVWDPKNNGSLLAALNLGTRTEFYNTLLPVVYSVDGWYRLGGNDPIELGWWDTNDGSDHAMCSLPYTARPAQSFVAYPNVNDPTLWDTFVIATTLYSGSFPNYEFGFPSEDLVTIMLGAPDPLGGTGLGMVPDLLFSANSTIPSRYALNTRIGSQPPYQNCGCVGKTWSWSPCSPNF